MKAKQDEMETKLNQLRSALEVESGELVAALDQNVGLRKPADQWKSKAIALEGQLADVTAERDALEGRYDGYVTTPGAEPAPALDLAKQGEEARDGKPKWDDVVIDRQTCTERKGVPGGWIYRTCRHDGTRDRIGSMALAFVPDPAGGRVSDAVRQNVADGDVCANCGHRTMCLSSGICSRCHQKASAALLGKLHRLHMTSDDQVETIDSLRAEVERLKGLNQEALAAMKEQCEILESKTAVPAASRKRMHVAEHAVERIRTLLDVRENRNGWNDDRMAEILLDYDKGETGPDLDPDEQADDADDGGLAGGDES